MNSCPLSLLITSNECCEITFLDQIIVIVQLNWVLNLFVGPVFRWIIEIVHFQLLLQLTDCFSLGSVSNKLIPFLISNFKCNDIVKVEINIHLFLIFGFFVICQFFTVLQSHTFDLEKDIGCTKLIVNEFGICLDFCH